MSSNSEDELIELARAGDTEASRNRSSNKDSGAPSNLTARALNGEAGALTRATLVGLQPADEVKLRIIKAKHVDEK